jgi:hypothetical protein
VQRGGHHGCYAVWQRLWPRPLVEPPLAFARAVAERAPATEVRILAPGEILTLP